MDGFFLRQGILILNHVNILSLHPSHPFPIAFRKEEMGVNDPIKTVPVRGRECFVKHLFPH